MRFLRHSLSGLFLLAVTIGLLVYAGQMVWGALDARMSREARVPQARERVFAVNVVAITPETITPVLQAFGEVQSGRTLDIRASAAGAIVELAPQFQEGGQVSEGQLLARIDPANAQTALDRVKSDLLDAQAESREADRALVLARDELTAAQDQVTLRERAFQRQIDLQQRGVGTAQAVETAELAVSSARQSVLTRRQALAQAEARIDQAVTRLSRVDIAMAEAQRKLQDTEIRAGFSGTLSNVSVGEGGLVSTNERLAQLVDSSQLEVAFRVSTAQYARLLNDAGGLRVSDVTVRLDVFGTALTAKGKLSRDSAAVGEGQPGRLIFARLDQARGLKPGDFVSVDVAEPQLTNVARLPSAAVSADGTVLALAEEDRLEEVTLRVLRRQGDDVLVRAPGLEGREVVAQRTPLLGAGIKVRPLRQDGQEAPKEPEMLELSADRRDKLVAFVEANNRMPKEAKERILAQLAKPKVPAKMVARIEARMGG